MEEHLLELFSLADKLNKQQEKIYAEITYCANDSKKLQISIRKKDTFEYVEECEMQLKDDSLINWETAIHVFEIYVNGRFINE